MQVDPAGCCKEEGLEDAGWGTSLVVWQLGFHAPTVGGLGSIPGQGTKILRATWWARPKKQKTMPDGHWDQHRSEAVATDGEGGIDLRKVWG